VAEIDGPWDITIATPMGSQRMHLELTTGGTQLSGVVTDSGGDLPLHDGVLDGAVIGFRIDLTFPFPMPARFTLTVDGDTLAGTSQAGGFPPSPVTGTRSAT
jgi:hypothetical protein